MKRVKKYSPETRERAVRLVWEQAAQHDSEWAAIRSISERVGFPRCVAGRFETCWTLSVR